MFNTVRTRKMTRKCFICGYSQKSCMKGSDVTFHELPKNPETRKTWLENLSWSEPLPEKKICHVCSLHFSPDKFSKVNSRTNLKRGSIPKVRSSFVESLQSEKENIPENVDTLVSYEEGSEEHFSEPTKKQKRQMSPGPSVYQTSSSGNQNEYTSSDTISLSSPSKCESDSGDSEAFKGKHFIARLRPKKTLKIPRYFGDFKRSHLTHPVLIDKFFVLAKNTVTKLRVTNRALQQRVRRLKTSITSLKSLIANLNQQFKVDEDFEAVLNLAASGPARDLMSRFLKGPSRQKYSQDLRAFALTLHYYSPRAYSYVRSTFNLSLPEPRTIRKWYEKIDGGPGFNKLALEVIKKRVDFAKQNNKQLIGALIMDEMSIRKLIEWTGKQFTGVVEWKEFLGKEDELLTEAKEVLVFLLVLFNDNYKIPVAYFFTNGESAEDKAEILRRMLDYLKHTGIIIASLTFDGLAANFKMAQILGANFSDINNLKPWFTYYEDEVIERKVFIILDPSHMIKLVRNCLGSRKYLLYGEDVVCWSHFEKLVDIQNSEGLHVATKLRLRHLNWEKEKMRVKLAVQTFSRSVSDALMFLEADLRHQNFVGAKATAEFCLTFNHLFDILNSRNLYCKTQYRKPFSKDTECLIKSFLNQSFNYISKLCLIDGTNVLSSHIKTGFLGFIIDIVSYQLMYNEFVDCSNPPLKFLLSYKMSQDHLEIYFGSVRSRGGFNNNPTARQFQAAFKRLLLHNEVKGPITGNISLPDSVPMLPLELQKENEHSHEAFPSMTLDDHCYFVTAERWHLTDYCKDIVSYIAGFVVSKLKRTVNCDSCLALLENDLIISKLQQRKTYGKLIKPSNYVIQLCQTAEKTFRWAENVHSLFTRKHNNILKYLVITAMSHTSSDLFNAFSDHLFEEELEHNHATLLSTKILEIYFNLRIHHENRNRHSLSTDINRIRSKFTKAVIFANQ